MRVMIIQADALNMPLADCSVDAIVTDPPYFLGFMNKEWDMPGKNIQESHKRWLTEAYRVLKPGGSMLVMGGTRTFHRLMCAIEDTGFIIKDVLMWVYGSGFPKAQDLSVMIDKQERAVFIIPKIDRILEEKNITLEQLGEISGIPDLKKSYWDWKNDGHSPSWRNWEKIKKATGITDEEERQVEREIIATVNFADNTPRFTNVYGEGGKRTHDITKPLTEKAQHWNGFKIGTIKPAYEPIVWAVRPPEGSYVDNVLKWGVGAVNVDECRIGSDSTIRKNNTDGIWSSEPDNNVHGSPKGRFPANLILDEESARVLDEQSGDRPHSFRTSRSPDHSAGEIFGRFSRKVHLGHADSGGASRFFYCAKSSRTERNLGLNKNILSLELEVCQCEENMEQVISLEKAISEWVTEMGNQECNMTLFGKDILAQSQKVIVSITLMGTSKTMKSRTWNSLILPLTKEFIADVLKMVQECGLSPVVNVDDSSPLQNIMNGNQELAPGVENAVSEMQLKINAKEEKNIHPTCKPLALFEWLIKLVTREGQTVLDPFLGSGTTAISAHNTGRKCIGIEKEGEYVKIARRRKEYWQSQPRQMAL